MKLHVPDLQESLQDFMPFFRQRPAVVDAEQNRRYTPPNSEAKPRDLFALKTNKCSIPGPRYIGGENDDTILLFVHGTTVVDGYNNARGGIGIQFRARGNISARLERPPPGCLPTANRAELRAAICALQLRYWPGEGFERIVLATDSEYVVLGACERLSVWVRRGWKTSSRTPIKNRDLWEILAAELQKWESKGISVQFWLVPRQLNFKAVTLARKGTQVWSCFRLGSSLFELHFQIPNEAPEFSRLDLVEINPSQLEGKPLISMNLLIEQGALQGVETV